MKNQTCCFTGHRKILKSEYAKIEMRLETELIKLIHKGIRYFCAGGALGFDTMAAVTVLKLKMHFPSIKLILVLPCLDQTKWWKEEDIKTYNRILNQADKIVYTSEQYDKNCMYKRNLELVKNSIACVCYLTKSTGGTAYTVKHAEARGLHIINLAQ